VDNRRRATLRPRGYRDTDSCGTIAGMVRGLLGRLLPLAGSALAVWLSTLLHIGITTFAKSGWGTVWTVLLIAVIFGLVNMIVKPIAKLIGCGIYVLTLGLIAIVVNGLLLLLTSWIAGELSIPFHVAAFWPGAIVGALFIGLVSWALNRAGDVLTKKRGGGPQRRLPPPPPPPRQQTSGGGGQWR
jgi:putative membrane protein